MRATSLILACVLGAIPSGSYAQDAAAPASPPQSTGFLDFGVRGSSVTGDGARYERYRDLGDGAFLEGAGWRGERRGWFFALSANHVGRKDQREEAEFTRPGTVRMSLLWDQIPMLMSRNARTLFTTASPGVLVIDNAIQTQVQASTAALPGIFAASARTIELSTARHLGRGGVEIFANPDLTFYANVQGMKRKGDVPFGGSFGHSSLVETPAPVDHTLVDVDAGAEYAHNALLVRAGYTGSFFRNDITALTFDTPFRAADSATVPSRGRIALAPSNNLLGVNGLASVRLARHSRLTGTIALGSLSNTNTTFILPSTVNTALAVVANERTRVDGEARTTSGTLTFTSRPTNVLSVDLRYRMYDYDNRTPGFTITQRVAYDNAISTLAKPNTTEPFGLKRETVDADVRLTPWRGGGAAGIGFTRTSEERTHRIFEATHENGVRATFDLPNYRVLTLRGKVEHSEKRGVGDEAEIAAELGAVGEQAGMRHFDIASRNRNRATLIGSVLASESMAFTFSAAAGKDDYLQSLFGLRDNAHRIFSGGVEATPAEHLSVGASYEYERDKALQRSRQANPGVQFDDPSRNWAADGADTMHSILINAGVVKIADKLDVQLSYDYNRSRALYTYITGPVADRTLPDEALVDTTLPTPTQLPLIKSGLRRGTVDVTYALRARVSLGVSYWYEDYQVSDFTLDAEANPELARGQALLIEYLYRPYTAHTAWGRVIIHW